MLADAQTIEKMHRSLELKVNPLRDEILELKKQLLESKRPFTAQMEMQNRRIVYLNPKLLPKANPSILLPKLSNKINHGYII